MKNYRKILIAVNGSLDVLKHGLKLAQDEKTWATVVKVIPPYEGDLDLTSVKSIEDVLESGVAKVLADIKSTADAEGALVKMRVEEGDISEKIVEVAEEERCDLIVLGANKSKKFLSRLFYGSVVADIIDRAPCPVYVVRS